MYPTYERLSQILKYDPDTGVLTWIARPSKAAFKVTIGAEAGTLHRASGYRQIQIDRRIYKAHRLAWCLHHGEWPPMAIDHINGHPADNRACNLRLATMSQNLANSRRRKRPHRLKGACLDKNTGKWRAEITKNYKCTSLGSFDTEIEAHEAYVRAAKIVHGEFYCSGKVNPP